MIPISLDQVIKVVSVSRQIPIEQLLVPIRRNTRDVAIAKQVICYVCRQLKIPVSQKELAHKLNYRTHSSVLFGVSQVEKTMSIDADFKQEVLAIEIVLKYYEKMESKMSV